MIEVVRSIPREFSRRHFLHLLGSTLASPVAKDVAKRVTTAGLIADFAIQRLSDRLRKKDDISELEFDQTEPTHFELDENSSDPIFRASTLRFAADRITGTLSGASLVIVGNDLIILSIRHVLTDQVKNANPKIVIPGVGTVRFPVTPSGSITGNAYDPGIYWTFGPKSRPTIDTAIAKGDIKPLVLPDTPSLDTKSTLAVARYDRGKSERDKYAFYQFNRIDPYGFYLLNQQSTAVGNLSICQGDSGSPITGFDRGRSDGKIVGIVGNLPNQVPIINSYGRNCTVQIQAVPTSLGNFLQPS